MCIHTKLIDIQQKLKVPKGQQNSFGGYAYRSCEDIVEAAKKILPADTLLLLSDEIINLGDRYYIKATASLIDKEGRIDSQGWAREPQTKKGMDESQITGAASSYARKYALNGLFSIDDTKDADTDEFKKKENKAAEKEKAEKEALKAKADKIRDQLKQSDNLDVLDYVWKGFANDLFEIKAASTAAHSTLVTVYENMKTKLTPALEAAE